MAVQSLFDKHSNYNKEIILLAIKTMKPDEANLLQKGYGIDYMGKGHLYSSEQFSFDMTDKKLERRIEEVSELVKQGKTCYEIINSYSKQRLQGSLTSYFTSNNGLNKTSASVKPKVVVKQTIDQPTPPASIQKISKPLEEYFPISLRKGAMKYVKEHVSEEEMELLKYFFVDKNYEICRQYTDDSDKINQLNEFIKRVSDEVNKRSNDRHKQQRNSKGNVSSTKIKVGKAQEDKQIKENIELSKITTDSKKKELGQLTKNIDLNLESVSVDEKEKSDSKLKKRGRKPNGYLAALSEDEKEKAIIIIESFKDIHPHYYKTIHKKYSGKYYEIVNDVELSDEEKKYLTSAKRELNKLLKETTKESNQIEHSSASLVTPYNKVNKLNKSLEEYFPKTLKKVVMEYITTNISAEEQELLNYFFEGSNYEICKKFIDDPQKINQLSMFINRVNTEMIIKIKEQSEINSKSSIADENKVCHDHSDNKKRCRAKGFLELCEIIEEDKKIAIEIIENYFKENYSHYYMSITKRYSGEYYEIVNDIKLGKKDNNNITCAKIKLLNLLQIERKKRRAKEEQSKNDNLILLEEKIENNVDKPDDKLTNLVSDNKSKKTRKARMKKGYLASISENKRDLAVEIVKKYFKEQYPHYYEAITKGYSGEYYEIVNNIELSKQENNCIGNSKSKLYRLLRQENIKELIEKMTSKNQINNNDMNESSIINDKEEANIESIKLSDNEHIDLGDNNSVEKQIVDKCNNKVEDDIFKEIHINSIKDILNYEPIEKSYDLIFNYITKNKNNIFIIMTIDEIVDCYIENLDCFSDNDATLIIKAISIYEPSKIPTLINSSYFKNKLQFLTTKEQEYIYLTLLSYSKSYLTEDKVSEILEIDKEYLKEYQIMTNQEDVNKLNILFNKSK